MIPNRVADVLREGGSRATVMPAPTRRDHGSRHHTTRSVSTRHVAALEAAVTVRAARRNRHKLFDAVNVYATTDRTGAPLIVAYVHYRPGFWAGVTDVADVYEIPTEALTDL